MKTLLLMRHAKSSHDDANVGDHDRRLDERGRRDASRMAERLNAAGLLPDLILCSTAVRARETADYVAGTAGRAGTLRHDERLYLASPEAVLAAVAESGGDDERLMVVGHNPGLEQLVARLTGFGRGMPTAAIARIELRIRRWDEAENASTEAKLVDYWTPKDGE